MRTDYREIPCDLCRTLTRAEFLVPCDDLFPLARLVCEDCEHGLVADSHDDPACICESCTRIWARTERMRREAEARTQGGLAPIAHELLGPGWLDDTAPSRPRAPHLRGVPMSAEAIAQAFPLESFLPDVHAEIDRLEALGETEPELASRLLVELTELLQEVIATTGVL